MTERGQKDGGAAFPFPAEYGHPAACGGMTLRDYFAAKALQGMLAGFNDYLQANKAMGGTRSGPVAAVIAADAYAYAYAMLQAREKTT